MCGGWRATMPSLEPALTTSSRLLLSHNSLGTSAEERGSRVKRETKIYSLANDPARR